MRGGQRSGLEQRELGGRGLGVGAEKEGAGGERGKERSEDACGGGAAQEGEEGEE